MPVIVLEHNKAVNGKVVEHTQAVEIHCENPNCQRGDNRSRKVVKFNPDDPEKLPEEVWSILYLVDYKSDRYTFCSKGCLQSFILDYKPLKPPSQQNIVHFPDKKE